TLAASGIDRPGTVVGIYKMVPSFSGGMNSVPRRVKTGIVTNVVATAIPSVSHRTRSAPERRGRYNAISNQFKGFLDSDRMRPRMRRTIRTGATVTESPVANSIANVFV